jgi:hypothetical protein
MRDPRIGRSPSLPPGFLRPSPRGQQGSRATGAFDRSRCSRSWRLTGTPPTPTGSRFAVPRYSLVGMTMPTRRSELSRVQLGSPPMREVLRLGDRTGCAHLECRGLVALL